MDYIMITFIAKSRNVDLKVPAFVKIEELLEMLAEGLNIHINRESKLQAEPLGRILDNGKTLEQENVSQGSILTLI